MSTISVISDITAERDRQRRLKDYTAAHDDAHDRGEMAMAAACYAAPRRIFRLIETVGGFHFADPWPWEHEFDKRTGGHSMNKHELVANEDTLPGIRRRLLVKAAALLVAEIERLDRVAAKT